jgi:hypothetical protein
MGRAVEKSATSAPKPAPPNQFHDRREELAVALHRRRGGAEELVVACPELLLPATTAPSCNTGDVPKILPPATSLACC